MPTEKVRVVEEHFRRRGAHTVEINAKRPAFLNVTRRGRPYSVFKSVRVRSTPPSYILCRFFSSSFKHVRAVTTMTLLKEFTGTQLKVTISDFAFWDRAAL